MPLQHTKCFASPTGLVSISASMLLVVVYLNSTSFLCTLSLAKWCMTSMCFERTEEMGFFRSLIAAWLSAMMVTVPILRSMPYSAVPANKYLSRPLKL